MDGESGETSSGRWMGKVGDIEWEMDGESGETSSGRWMGKVVRHRVGDGWGKW